VAAAIGITEIAAIAKIAITILSARVTRTLMRTRVWSCQERKYIVAACVGVWRRLVAHTLGVRVVAGSNPATPTISTSILICSKEMRDGFWDADFHQA
jgi:hypothetical protein